MTMKHRIKKTKKSDGSLMVKGILSLLSCLVVVLIAFSVELAIEKTGDPWQIQEWYPTNIVSPYVYFVSSKIYGTSTKGTYSSVESSQGGGGGARGLTEDNHDEEEEKYEDDTDSQCTGGNCENPDTSAPDNIPKGANPEGKPKDVKLGDCFDRHEACAWFSSEGECEKNPGWMIVNCPISCNSCDLLDYKKRCSRRNLNITDQHAYGPGDMNRMFEGLHTSFADRYTISYLSNDPYIVRFDNFLSDIEIDELLKSVNDNWERSTDTGSVNEFGETGRVLSEGRTSNNAWCRQDCENNVHVQNINRKISEITQVPVENFEAFQVLRYQIGQKYSVHHDASPVQSKQASGARILTFFLYLSDVEEGGETAFPTLNVAVKPKKGSAILWPSCLNSDPYKIDSRTMHEAKPVVRGVKFAANTWIHSHNFAKSNLWGCTGTFDVLDD